MEFKSGDVISVSHNYRGRMVLILEGDPRADSDRVCARRWIKSTQKFSGNKYWFEMIDPKRVTECATNLHGGGIKMFWAESQ